MVDGSHIHIFANGTLAIISTQRSDAGMYTCTAKNLAGRASHDMRLLIQGRLRAISYHVKSEYSRFMFNSINKYLCCCISVPPMIPPAQTELSVIQGFQALLPCAAQGSPDPRVTWEKDGAVVPVRPGKFTRLRSGELIIERAEVSLIFFTALLYEPQLCLALGIIISFDCFLHSARRCRHVYMCSHQRSGLCETRHPPVHQHEACLQGAARGCDPEQRTESGLVLPRSRNTFSCHLLDCQQQSSHRYSLQMHFNTSITVPLCQKSHHGGSF